MNKRIVFRHMEHSDVMEKYANEKLEKIIHFLENEREPIFIDLYLISTLTWSYVQMSPQKLF